MGWLGWDKDTVVCQEGGVGGYNMAVITVLLNPRWVPRPIILSHIIMSKPTL